VIVMQAFWMCFVPLFVAVDPVGVLPLYVSLTHGIEKRRRRVIVLEATLTAAVVAEIFVLFGSVVLAFLGITVPDFLIAGGLLLLAISLSNLLTGEKKQRDTDGEIGAVPVGVPLITGPAVLTTSIVLAGIHGKAVTAVAVLVNIALAGVVFLFADVITRLMGRSGSRTVSKLANLLLAAIAVMLIRRGVVGMLASAT
jgi:multiple antibiotic resistance protein